MILKKIFVWAVTATAAMGVISCGSDKSSSDIAADQNTELTSALQQHDLRRASTIADSMAMYIDELTPDETITVLMAFLEVHNEAAAQGERKRDLETIRKFVDVYDIAMSLNPNDFKAAVIRANKLNPNLNFPQIMEDFRDKLAEYEATSGEPEPEETTAQATDSTATATKANPADAPEIVKPNEGDDTEVPLEHRPAE